jgi:hypothetical protein
MATEIQALIKENCSLHEAYQFSYSPSFDHAINFRIWFEGLFQLHARATVFDSYDSKIIRQQEWMPDYQVWLALTALMEQHAFWSSESWWGWPDDMGFLDGAFWYFEGYRNGHYKTLNSWSPKKDFTAYIVGMFFFDQLPHDIRQLIEIY